MSPEKQCIHSSKPSKLVIFYLDIAVRLRVPVDLGPPGVALLPLLHNVALDGGAPVCIWLRPLERD